jgi:hypothetical protein
MLEIDHPRCGFVGQGRGLEYSIRAGGCILRPSQELERLPKVLSFYFPLPLWARARVRGDRKKLMAIKYIWLSPEQVRRLNL